MTAVDRPSQLVVQRLMADLLHINRRSQEVEAALADSWTVSEDGLVYRLELRRERAVLGRRARSTPTT